MTVKISKWYGRFGNNIIQLINAIRYSLETNNYFCSPDHKYLKKIEINSDKKNQNTLNLKKLFFYDYQDLGLDNRAYDIAQNYIKYNIKNIPVSKYVANSNILHIHIRSGDVFSNNPNKNYVQNPLVYFEKIIKQYGHTIIISENDKNPVINYLKNKNGVEIKINRPLEEDIAELLSATNICLGGVGSFATAICLLSSNIKNIYTSNIQHPIFKPNFKIENVTVHKTYIDTNTYMGIGDWINSEQQRNLMVNYKNEK